VIVPLLLALLQFDFSHLYQKAIEDREKQFGPQHPKVARSLVDYALYLRENKKGLEARPLLERALAIDEAAHFDSAFVAEDLEHLATLQSPREALESYRRAIAIRVKLGPSVELASALEKAADHSRADEAIALLKRALDLRQSLKADQTLEASLALNSLGLLLQEGEPQQAEAAFRRGLAMQTKLLGLKHPETATTQNNLGSLMLTRNRVGEAEILLRQALATLEATLGPRDARVGAVCSNLGDALRAKGQLAAAEKLYRRTLAIDEANLGPDHPEVAVDLENLASLLEARGSAAAARSLRERAETIRRR
jgi:tetratricopeptide (TPR) repeat protein